MANTSLRVCFGKKFVKIGLEGEAGQGSTHLPLELYPTSNHEPISIVLMSKFSLYSGILHLKPKAKVFVSPYHCAMSRCNLY